MKHEYPQPDIQSATVFIEAIKTIANKPENLDNLHLYLSMHFREWLAMFANTPEDIAGEMREFANMIIDE